MLAPLAPRGGRRSRLTIAQVALIRRVYAELQDVKAERRHICARLDLNTDEFSHIGAGRRGKNPRPNCEVTA